MALVALAGREGRAAQWAQAFAHRFGGSGELAGHALGNLVLTALATESGDPVRALDAAAELLGCYGRVLPLSPEPVDIVAQVKEQSGGLAAVRGQVAVATTTGRVETVELVPNDPPPCPEALAAVAAADALVLGTRLAVHERHAASARAQDGRGDLRRPGQARAGAQYCRPDR